MQWFTNLLKENKYNITFDFQIDEFLKVKKNISKIYDKVFEERKVLPFSKKIKNRFQISSDRVFPKYIFDKYGSWEHFKNSSEMSPDNKATYCYVKYLMNYGKWLNVPGDDSDFDAIKYLISILDVGKNNPYSLVHTSYIPWLYKPWISNPNRPPLRTGMTQCIWNIRPMIKGINLDWYVSWRASRYSYLLGNIDGLIRMFQKIIQAQYSHIYKMRKFRGHIVSLENNMHRDEQKLFFRYIRKYCMSEVKVSS